MSRRKDKYCDQEARKPGRTKDGGDKDAQDSNMAASDRVEEIN